MMKKTMKVKVNSEALAGLLGVKPGASVDVECKSGVPVSKEWRNRLKDAKIDDCISLVEKNRKTTKESN